MSSDFQRGEEAGATRIIDAANEGDQNNQEEFPTLVKGSEEQLTNELENRDEEEQVGI